MFIVGVTVLVGTAGTTLALGAHAPAPPTAPKVAEQMIAGRHTSGDWIVDPHQRIVPFATPSPSPSAEPPATVAAAPMVTNTRVQPPTLPRYSANGFVTRYGTSLWLNGRQFRFAGLNIYNANSIDMCWYPLGSGSGLDQSLSDIGAGQTVFRAWFFQRLATRSGVRDWSAFDHTLAVARAHGERVIATLTNQWTDCEESIPGYKNQAWYQSGYRSHLDSSVPASYRDWVAEIVSRYRNNPTIMAWQLVNEAEDPLAQGGTCAATAPATMRAFALDTAGLIKSIDRNHLVSLGTMGPWVCGLRGSAYGYVHSVPQIDLCEYHDYAADRVAMPNSLQSAINQCRALGKPIFVGETGIQVNAVGSVANRAAAFRVKFAAQFSAGVVGELVWNWLDASHAAYDGYAVGPGDPALSVLGTR